LLEEAGAVAGVHGDELDRHAVTIADAANDGSAADLSHGQVQQDLNEAAQRDTLLGADKEPTDRQTFHERHAPLSASLPSYNHTFGRFYTGIAALIRSVHQGALRGKNSSVEGGRRSSENSVKFEFRRRLLFANSAGGNIRLVIVFPANGDTGKAAEHRKLANVVQGIGQWTLEKFFGRGVKLLRAGEKVVESF
jgi:hypothetical protein